MGAVFKSAAFLKQCFEVHPMDLQCKSLVPPSTLVVVCKQCEISNRVMLAEISGPEDEAREALARCVASHPDSLRLQAMEIETDMIGFFCGHCRVARRFTGLGFESTLED